MCGSVLGINVYLANARGLVGNQLPMPFGYGAAVVLSGSMEPTFSQGDLIIVRQTDTFATGDVVVFQEGNTLVVHRIVEVGQGTVTTKGDANNAVDQPVEVSSVKGTVLFWIPYAGRIVTFLKSPVGTIGVFAAAVALIELPGRKEKQQDAQERQKLIDEIERLKKERQE